MTTRYEAIVTVDDHSDKRRQLITGIDMALCAGGARITTGAYVVEIRRLSKKEIEDMKDRENASED